MKKLYTLVMAFCVTFALNAQENLNLDDWSDEITPIGWNALLNDFIGILGPDTSVIQVDGYNNSGAKLNCVDGTLLLGVPSGITLMSLGEDSKPAYDQMLDEVTFYYNFTDEVGATAAAFVALTKWNDSTMVADTLASGDIQITAPNTEFELATVALETSALYTPGDTPDSLSISVQIVSVDPNSVNATNIVVDEFVLVPMGQSSVKEALVKTPAKVYPTVASNNVTVEFKDAVNRTIEILDVNGAVVKTANVNNVSNNVNVSDINAGSYIYRIMKGDVMVNNGKLIIE